MLAAAANPDGRSDIVSLEMTTSATPAPTPKVTLTAGETTTSTLRFILTPTDAEMAVYSCYPKGAPEPTVEELLRTGTQADASLPKQYEIKELQPRTDYIIVAATSKGETVSQRARIEMTTQGNNPSLQLELIEATSNSVRFAVTPQRSDRMCYICYKAGDHTPDAEQVMHEGRQGDPTQYATYLVEGLEPATEYVIAGAVANGAELSAVETLEATTAAPEPPAFGDFYYSDGSWSSGAGDPLPGKSCIGVVFYAGRCQYDAEDDCAYLLKDGTTPLEEVHGYVLALNNAADKVAWGSWDVDGNAGAGTSYRKNDFRGYSNTQSIRAKAIAKAGGLSDDPVNNYPATYYATEVYEQQVPSPASSTGWFLPSAYQLFYLFTKTEALNAAFDKLGDGVSYVYRADAQYWSSSECQKQNGCRYWAYYVSLDSNQVRPGFITDFRKSADWYDVRSILVF